MAYRKIEPDWVCFSCAEKRGARVPDGHLCTVHVGVCGICLETKQVTEPRDFGVTRSLLKVFPPEIREKLKEYDRKRYKRKHRDAEYEERYKAAKAESRKDRKRIKSLEK